MWGGAGGEGGGGPPMTVNTAASDTASHSTWLTTPYAEGTTSAATLDATLSHAVLMLRAMQSVWAPVLERSGSAYEVQIGAWLVQDNV